MMRALALALLATAGEGLHRRVYFIGNSFTYRYGEPDDRQGLPAAVAALAAARGDSLEWDWHVRGGATVSWHVENGVLDALRSAPARYDAVILQAHSQELATSRAAAREQVWPHAAAIANATAAAGHGALWLYLTWEYPGGDSSPGADIDAFQERLNTGTYELAAALGGAPVAPAGLAWRAARERGGDALHARLFDKDEKHPNTLGTYLNALVFHAALFDYPERASLRALPSPGALGLFGAAGTPDEDADAAVLRVSALAPQGSLLLATCDEDDGATARAALDARVASALIVGMFIVGLAVGAGGAAVRDEQTRRARRDKVADAEMRRYLASEASAGVGDSDGASDRGSDASDDVDDPPFILPNDSSVI